ncbi:MAG: pirin family protein [Pseudomonadales bacterium]|nr:pirin family protein [Pseudomonadales bacterium]
MLYHRPSEERGRFRIDWLDSRHSFSFGSYHDPRHMGFGPLRVINEDHIAPGGGFDTHPHRDMEIITYVLSGALEHRDSLGNGSVIRPGDVQHMSAGTGIRHSEYNASSTDSVWLLQIWIEPAARNLPPGYQQVGFAPDELAGRLRLVASGDGRDGSVRINQDADVYAARLDAGVQAALPARSGPRRRWVQVIEGTVKVRERTLGPGDALGILDGDALELEAVADAHLLAFDLP